MTKVATIVLNRNLPEVTDQIIEKLQAQDCGNNDIFVVESGSSQDKLSKYCTWWADWPDALREGLRYPRGFNYGLSQMVRTGRFSDYTYYFLVCNDLEFTDSLLDILVEEMELHPRVGIMMPCSVNWEEQKLIGEKRTCYISQGNLIAWMVRRTFIESIMERYQPSYMNFLFDGTNFRGYFAEQELIIKGYVNEYATAITTKCLIRERTELLKSKFDLIKTDRYEISQRRMFEEGLEWMRRKYGFNSRLQMSIYSAMFYERFFQLHPQLSPHRL